MRKDAAPDFQHMDEQCLYIDVFQSVQPESAMISDHMYVLAVHDLERSAAFTCASSACVRWMATG